MAFGFKILHLIANMRWTGVAEPAVSLIQHQLRAGYDVEVCAIRGRSLEAQLKSRQIPLFKGMDLNRSHNPLRLWREVRKLRTQIASAGVRIVHCHLLHDHWMAALALRGLAPDKRPLLIRTVHRYEVLRTDPWHRWLFGQATNVLITVSTEQSRSYLATYPQLQDRIRIALGGIDPLRFRPDISGDSVRADMGERPGARIAGIVAHLGYNRGHRWLLKAAPDVLKALPDAVIWIVGHGELRRELRRELLKPEYDGRVQLAGYRRDDLSETYAALDCGLLLGLGSEGSARATLECMATARPVIAVAKGAMVDTITDGTDGFLVDQDDVPALTKRLIELLGDPDKCSRMGAAAREKVLASFTEQSRFDATEKIYSEALERQCSGASAQ